VPYTYRTFLIISVPHTVPVAVPYDFIEFVTDSCLLNSAEFSPIVARSYKTCTQVQTASDSNNFVFAVLKETVQIRLKADLFERP
jgi:hypothetical protein